AIEALQFWEALDIVDTYFDVAAFGQDSSGMWNAEQISLFLSLLYPVLPEIAIRYGQHFFGLQWWPSLVDSLREASLPARGSVDFPYFSEPIPASLIAACNERFGTERVNSTRSTMS